MRATYPTYFIVFDLINRITICNDTDHKAPRCNVSCTPVLLRLFITKYVFKHPFIELYGLIE
jgi:hypothetical protein